MQRNILVPILGGVVAAVVLIAALVLIGTRHKTTEITLASPSVTAVPPPSPSASGSPIPSATAAASASATAAKTAAPAKPTPTPHPVRSPKSVDCNNPSDQRYCSVKDGTIISNGTVTTEPSNKGETTGPDEATITMKSTVSDAGSGKHKIHVEVTVANNTKKTFRFPAREVVLDVYKHGKPFNELSTTGEGFDMAPGTKMTATFDQTVTQDGTYYWQAKTWYYAE